MPAFGDSWPALHPPISLGRDSTPDRDRGSIYGSRALYSASDVKPHQSQSFQTLEEISSILISEMKKKPRKEKALRDALELQAINEKIVSPVSLKVFTFIISFHDRIASTRLKSTWSWRRTRDERRRPPWRWSWNSWRGRGRTSGETWTRSIGNWIR